MRGGLASGDSCGRAGLECGVVNLLNLACGMIPRELVHRTGAQPASQFAGAPDIAQQLVDPGRESMHIAARRIDSVVAEILARDWIVKGDNR